MFWNKENRLRFVPTNAVSALGTNFSEFEIAELDKLGTLVTLDAGSTLALEGTIGREVVVIVAGTALVTRDDAEIAHVAAGDIVGELSILSGERRNASVVAQSAVEAYVLTGQEFRSLLTSCPRLADNVASIAAERLATA